MSDLFKSLKPTAHVSRNSFDLSQKHVFSLKAGLISPVACVETVPNDYFQVDLASTIRSMTLNRPAFIRGKFSFDSYFVPYSQLWHPFNQFISQRTDKHSSSQKGHSYCPVINLGALLNAIYSIYRGADDSDPDDDVFFDIFGNNVAEGMIRMLDMLGYGNFSVLLHGFDLDDQKAEAFCDGYKAKYVNLFRAAAYQHIWYDIYRNKYYDIPDSDGDDDYIEAFNFDDLSCSTFATSILDCPSWSVSMSDSDRQKLYRVVKIFSLRYCQWKKDIFTSSMPGQQFGAVSTVQVSTGVVSSSETEGISSYETGSDEDKWHNLVVDTTEMVTSNGNTSLKQSDGEIWHTHSIGSHTHEFTYRNPATKFDVLSLRKAEMLQAWKQATLRAGNMTDDNFRAHFGVEPRFDSDENVVRLQSWEAPFAINSVEATASTSEAVNGAVGDLAATGSSFVQGSQIDYRCQDFGVIVVVAYFRPEADYRSLMMDKANTLYEQFDFFTPEFQNLGLEAIPLSAYDNISNSGHGNDIIGYSPRYAMYKQAIDKIHGEFISYDVQDGEFDGSLTAWAAPRVEDLAYFGDTTQRKISSFYVNPSVLDSVLGVRASENQNTDQFVVNTMLSVKAIRPMSVLGLPQF